MVDVQVPFHCLSLTFHCLSLPFVDLHCLLLTFHCLSLTFHCLSLPFVDLSLPFVDLSLPFSAFHRNFVDLPQYTWSDAERALATLKQWTELGEHPRFVTSLAIHWHAPQFQQTYGMLRVFAIHWHAPHFQQTYVVLRVCCRGLLLRDAAPAGRPPGDRVPRGELAGSDRLRGDAEPPRRVRRPLRHRRDTGQDRHCLSLASPLLFFAKTLPFACDSTAVLR